MKALINTVNNTSIYAVKGSIFDDHSVDVVALFRYPGLACLPIEIDDFLRDKSLGNDQGVLIPCEGKHGATKAVYYVKLDRTDYKAREFDDVLFTFLDKVSEAGFSSVAMNGIRTKWDSEEDNLRAIESWALFHLKTSIKSILLFDKRGGFNRFVKRGY